MEKAMKEEEGWILVRKDGKAQSILPGMMFIGREECDITLQSTRADKRHAVIFYDAKIKELLIKDLNSISGTYVNGARIAGQTYVKLGAMDNLRFGYGPDIFYIHQQKLAENKSVNRGSPQIFSENRNLKPTLAFTSMQPDSLNSNFGDVLKSNLQDSLEETKKSQSYGEANILDSNHQSISPSFSSLTYKRNTVRTSQPSSEQASRTSSASPDIVCQGISLAQEQRSSPSKLSRQDQSSPIRESPTRSQEPQDDDLENSELAPPAMAFTVAFDNPMPKKKFSIRDSISKYAPRKAELEHPPKQKQTKNVEPLFNKVSEPTLQKPGQFEQHKKKTLEKLQSDPRLKSPSDAEPKLSNGANFLIEKMFDGEPDNSDPYVDSQPNSPVRRLPSRGTSSSGSKQLRNERRSDNDDAKSDTGTYTVDEELDDKVVKEAREKIDEVFGIAEVTKIDSKPQMCLARSPMDFSKSLSNASDFSPTDRLSSSQNFDQPIIVPARTKRRLPTPPGQSPMECYSPQSDEKSRLSPLDSLKNRSCATLPFVSKEAEARRMLPMFEKKSIPTSKISLSLPSKKLTINNLELLQNSCSSDKSSPDVPLRRTPPYSGSWRRSPWNLSGSDMDLDQMRIETSSVLSDVSASTEPPSGPVSGRADTGPQMKFNRAFALRRARLGLETELPPASKSLVNRDSKIAKDNSRSAPAVVPFSRQDGGRFSLRLPKSATKTQNKPAAVKSSPSTTSKFGHNRMSSDPSRTAFLRRPDLTPETTRRQNHRPTFQRATSFTNSDNSHHDSDSDIQKNYRTKLPERPSAATAAATVRSIPRISQVTNAAKDMNVNVSQANENRLSPKPMEKQCLSALDSLVIQAAHQLSAKLRTISHHLLIKERDKFTEDSSERLMIDEVLPAVSDGETSTCSTCSERGASQDLASILKNLKRVEQSLKVLTVVIDEERMDHRRMHNHHNHGEADPYYYGVEV